MAPNTGSQAAGAQGAIEHVRDGVHGAITIANPARRNAMSHAMWLNLAETVTRLDEDPGIRLITLRGAGDTFVSGADISEFGTARADSRQAAAYEAANGAAFAALRNARTPTLALIEGVCFGGGVGLAVACDLRMASDTARFAVPAAKLGLAYPVAGMRDLVRLVGPGAAKKLLFTADPIGAEDALRIGLIEDLVPAASFQAETERRIATLSARAPLTQRAAKSAIGAALGSVGEETAGADATACFESHDYAEGWQAFLEKRKPRFEGR